MQITAAGFRNSRTLHQVRPVPHSTTSHPADCGGQLNRRHCNGPLANRHRNCLAGVPFFALCAQFPFRGGHEALGFARQVNTGLFTEARHLRVLGDAVDPGLVPDVVEIHIAGLDDAPVQLHRAVRALDPAFEIAAVEGRSAAAMH